MSFDSFDKKFNSMFNNKSFNRTMNKVQQMNQRYEHILQANRQPQKIAIPAKKKIKVVFCELKDELENELNSYIEEYDIINITENPDYWTVVLKLKEPGDIYEL